MHRATPWARVRATPPCRRAGIFAWSSSVDPPANSKLGIRNVRNSRGESLWTAKVSGRLHVIYVGPNRPRDGLGNVGRVGHPRAGCPQHPRLGPIANVADMLLLVLVDNRIGDLEADGLAEPLQVVVLASQESPPRPGLESVAVMPDRVHVVPFRVERER